MKILKNSLLFLMLTLGIFLVSCSSTNKYITAFENYKSKWLKNDFSAMYEMLNSESKNYIDKETFVNRYSNIYSALEIEDLQIELSKDIIENNDFITIPFTLKANTIAGELYLDNYTADIYKEDERYTVKWDESLIFPDMIAGDKVLVENTNSSRGKIFDRTGSILAEDGEINVVGIYPATFDLENSDEKIEEIANVLDISIDTIKNKLSENSDPEHFVPIVDILSTDEKLNNLRNRENDGILIKNKTSRIYNGGQAFGRLIGYIGNITSEELEANKSKGYNSESLIGKAGIEQVYEYTLRGYDGSEIYLDRNGEYITILKKEPVNGNDITLSIDSSIQNKAYSELNGEKGSVTAVDPKTGEVLALVSAPSYDSNLFTTYVTKTQAAQWEENNYTDQINRFSNVYLLDQL